MDPKRKENHLCPSYLGTSYTHLLLGNSHRGESMGKRDDATFFRAVVYVMVIIRDLTKPVASLHFKAKSLEVGPLAQEIQSVSSTTIDTARRLRSCEPLSFDDAEHNHVQWMDRGCETSWGGVVATPPFPAETPVFKRVTGIGVRHARALQQSLEAQARPAPPIWGARYLAHEVLEAILFGVLRSQASEIFTTGCRRNGS